MKVLSLQKNRMFKLGMLLCVLALFIFSTGSVWAESPLIDAGASTDKQSKKPAPPAPDEGSKDAASSDAASSDAASSDTPATGEKTATGEKSEAGEKSAAGEKTATGGESTTPDASSNGEKAAPKVGCSQQGGTGTGGGLIILLLSLSVLFASRAHNQAKVKVPVKRS